MLVLIDEAAALLAGHPILAGDMKRRADLGGAVHDHRKRSLGLAGDDGRRVAPHDRRLLARDLLQRVAEKIHMIHGNRGDDARERVGDRIGRVVTAAEPDFEQQRIRRMVGK